MRLLPYARRISVTILLAGMICLPLGSAAQAASETNPLAGQQLYIDSNDKAARQAAEWQATRPADADKLTKVSRQPRAYWLGGSIADVRQAAADYTSRADAAGKVGVVVAYNIPSRDCGSYSAGGTESYAGYRTWIDNLAAGIADRKTVVILEPDALPQLSCLDDAGRSARLQALTYAVTKLKQGSATAVYIDIGNKSWLKPQDAAEKLLQAGIHTADGFSLNVSNFYATSESVRYGNQISDLVGGKHFIIDTSRNGVDTGGEWCNPAGAGLGLPPTLQTGQPRADAYLWVKIPGESDGLCNGGPAAGSWWPEYALGLAERAATPPTGSASAASEVPAADSGRQSRTKAYVLTGSAAGLLIISTALVYRRSAKARRRIRYGIRGDKY